MKPLQSESQHWPINFLENIITDTDYIVGRHSNNTLVVCSMMYSTQRETVANRSNPVRVGVRKNVGRIKEHGVTQGADGTTCLISLQNTASKHWLVQPRTRLLSSIPFRHFVDVLTCRLNVLEPVGRDDELLILRFFRHEIHRKNWPVDPLGDTPESNQGTSVQHRCPEASICVLLGIIAIPLVPHKTVGTQSVVIRALFTGSSICSRYRQGGAELFRLAYTKLTILKWHFLAAEAKVTKPLVGN